MTRGRFITLEGIDGAGKSTHLMWLADHLRCRNLEVIVTREPGGTALGEKIRGLVLSEAMHIDTETLLMFAARREHLAKVILPALDAGKWVISDRFTDATYAYQGGGHRMALDRIKVLEEWVHKDFQPDITLVFHLPLEVAALRRGDRSSRDKFEQQDRDFFGRVSSLYLDRARRDPERMKIIDASQSIEQVQRELEALMANA
jgi:dTMP kinase